MASATTRFAAAVAHGAMVFAAITFAGGCHMTAQKGPTGLLGLKWNDDATGGARQIGLACDHWDAWIDPAFETSLDVAHPRAVLGAEGVVRLVRADGKQLEGVQVIYRGCARDSARKQQLREGLRRELNVKSPDVDVPYEVWEDHSLVHLATDPSDDTCTLTVAGPRFGKAFADALMRGGLGNLGGATGPR
jgi:hypothetical protein